MNSSHHTIFYIGNEPSEHAGGPSGYLANLKKAFSCINTDFPLLVSRDCAFPFFIRLLSCLVPTREKRKKVRSWLLEKIYGQESLVVGFLQKKGKKALLSKQLRWVIANDVLTFARIKFFLQKHNPRVKVALMSHTPETVEKEECASWKKLGYPQKEINRRREIIHRIERWAFEIADAWIFPTPEAMTPCKQEFPWFDNLSKNKKIYFIPTGCEDLRSKTTPPQSEIIKKYKLNPNASLRICYIGRHNKAKGYDILVRAAQELLENYSNINLEFVIGGNVDEISPPKHHQWKECGRVNPAELFSVSDVFVLPNDSTYFDLILLEALSFGIPVIASATGGNISVQQKCPDLILFERGDASALSKCIQSFSKKTTEQKASIAHCSRSTFLDNYTLTHFAKRYSELLRELSL